MTESGEIAARLRDNGLEQVLFNVPPGDWAKGDRGIGCPPERGDEFRAGVGKALDYAEALGTAHAFTPWQASRPQASRARRVPST